MSTVSFDLQLAIKDFNNNLKNVDKNLNNFHKDFKSEAKRSSQAWASFVGNLGAIGVETAIRGLASLTSGMASFTRESILAAVEAQETASKFEAVFSTISRDSEKMARDLQRNYGLGTTESKTLLSATGDLLTGFGFAQDEALKLSGEVQKLSVDLASFTNYAGGAQGASEAITKALLGERESVKALGVSIQEKAVQDQIAINAAKGMRFETEQQAKAQATLDLIIKQSGNAIGDYAKTNGGAANQIRLFHTRIEDLKILFGGSFLPVLEPVITMVNEFMSSIDEKQLGVFVKDGIVKLIDGFSLLVKSINPVVTAVKNIGHVFNIIQNGITAGLSTIGAALATAARGWVNIFREMLTALPASLVPDGWIEGLNQADEAITEVVSGLTDQITTDSQDMSNSLNNIFNPENIISEDTVAQILEKTNIVKEGVIGARNEIDADELARKKAKEAAQKKQDILDKKRKEQLNKEKIKQSEFEEELFGKQLSWEETGGKERAQNLKSTLNRMASLSQSGNKTLAGIGRASAISTATIDGYVAVQKALAAAPPPFNFALASTVGIATAANVAKIAGVRFEHGGIVPGSSFAGDSVQARVNSGEMIINRSQQSMLFQQLNNGGSANSEGVVAAINSLGERLANLEVVLVADDTEIARSTSRGVQNGIEIGRSR